MENENSYQLAVSTIKHLQEEIKKKNGNTEGRQQLVDEITRKLAELPNNPTEEYVAMSAQDYHNARRPYLPDDLRGVLPDNMTPEMTEKGLSWYKLVE